MSNIKLCVVVNYKSINYDIYY